jgi:hypothetical protein
MHFPWIGRAVGCALLTGGLGLGSGCTNATSDTVDTEVDLGATLAVTSASNVDALKAGDTVPLELEVGGQVVMVPPDMEPPSQYLESAVYVEVLLDDRESLLVTAEAHADVTIPSGTPQGPHTLVCRLKKHDDGTTSASFSLPITVTGAVST